MVKTKFVSIILVVVFAFCSVCFLPGCFGASKTYTTTEGEVTYTEMQNITETNSSLQNALYGMWEHDTSSDYYDFYHSVRGGMVYDYGTYFTIRSNVGEIFSVYTNKDYIATYTETYVVAVYEDNTKAWKDNVESLSPLTVPDKLDVVADSEGFLFVTKQNFMIYFTKDFSHYYINENNTNVFSFKNESYTVPSSEKLNLTLQTLGEYKKFEIPSPDIDCKILFSAGSDQANMAYVFFSEIWPLDYIEILKSSGFNVALSEHYGLFGAASSSHQNRDDNNVWLAFDGDAEFAVYVDVGWSRHYYNGTRLRILPANYLKSMYGTNVTTNTDWTEAEKTKMLNTYGAVVPFVALGSKYVVSTELTPNGDVAAHSNLGSMCYTIYDGHYNYLLDSYVQILENCGYVLYQPPVDFSSSLDEIKDWMYSFESKKYNCYINTQTNIAIRLKFNHQNGNVIQIFKYSTMEDSGYFKPEWR